MLHLLSECRKLLPAFIVIKGSIEVISINYHCGFNLVKQINYGICSVLFMEQFDIVLK